MSDPETIVMETTDLTRDFEGVRAVDHLNLKVRRGEIFGLVGPDGAGKTTTLRLLCGLLDASQGEVRVAGCPAAGPSQALKDRIGYMAQRFGLYVDLTVEENMRFYADLFGLSRERRQSLGRQLLAMARMEPFSGRRAGQLSGGMKQKLALMCALLHRPRLLLLDEPTNGLDPVSRRDFWTILYELVQGGMTVVISTAYLDEAERCHRVGLMYRGRMICCDSPRALKQQPGMRLFEWHTQDPAVALSILQDAPGIQRLQLAGTSLQLVLDPEVELETLGVWLRREGLDPGALIPRTPSLEDVFVFLIRQQEMAAA